MPWAEFVMHQLFCDGGSRGNPGISGGGAVIFDTSGNEVARKGIYTHIQTNNYAEYASLYLGLGLAQKEKIQDLQVFMDSKLVVEQMKGNWKIKNKNLIKIYQETQKLAQNFQNLKFQHIPREKNSIADSIANEVMDRYKK